MGRFYIHKVGHQEMGSVNSHSDKPARGRYFLISKSCLDFFPHISSVVKNDKVVLTIIPMNNGRVPQRILCTMDYHNQKYSDIEYCGENPRNEIRLYMNNEIDPNKQFFFKGDYAVFERFELDRNVFYSLTKITPTHDRYHLLTNILNKYEENSTEIHFINIRLNNGSWITPRNKMHVSRVIHGKTGYFSMPDSDWGFHMLRHTLAAELIAAGVSPLSVQKRLGDSRLE